MFTLARIWNVDNVNDSVNKETDKEINKRTLIKGQNKDTYFELQSMNCVTVEQ